MIFSENRKPSEIEFRQLMAAADHLLNADARLREDYYANRGGHPLEQDVYDAICECAKGTSFQDSIQLVSGSAFPDIVAARYYGVEVKSTNKNHWTSIGSSILESTRIQDIERIYLTFGKLGRPVEFLSRPYQECLSGIAVTHYPRYQIDMRLSEGETIFDKMGVSYDELRRMENPVAPVSEYYRKQLKPGERLWWAGDRPEEALPAKIRLWNTLSPPEKEQLIIQGYAYFPELLSGKYSEYALWLVTARGIVNTNIRDGFSAGGQVDLPLSDGRMVRVPATFGRIKKYSGRIADVIRSTDGPLLMEYWGLLDMPKDRLGYWCDQAALRSQIDPYIARDVLRTTFCLD